MSLVKSSFQSIRMPLFGITGTNDVGAAGETPEWRLESFHASPAGDKFAAVVDGFGHSDFDPPVDEPTRGAQGETLRRMQLEFWDGFLKARGESHVALTAHAIGSKAGDPIFVRAR